MLLTYTPTSIGEVIGSMAITFPVGLLIMSAIARPFILKRKWHLMLAIAFALSFITAFIQEAMIYMWIVMAAISYSFFRTENYFNEARKSEQGKKPE